MRYERNISIYAFLYIIKSFFYSNFGNWGNSHDFGTDKYQNPELS